MISNLLDIDFSHDDIHDRLYKKEKYYQGPPSCEIYKRG